MGFLGYRLQSFVTHTLTEVADLQDSQKSEAQRLLAEAEALMAEIGSGDYKARQAKQSAEAAKQAEAGLATQGLKLRCDVNGCVIVPINAQHSTPGLAGTVPGNHSLLYAAEHLHVPHISAVGSVVTSCTTDLTLVYG